MSDGELAALGKLAWDILAANRPTVNEHSDYISVLPKGAEWSDLSAPLGTNHYEWVWLGPGYIMHDFEFVLRLEWTYGARYRGGRAFVPNAVVKIVDHNIGFGGYNININCRVGHIENVGSDRAPVPRIPIDVSLSYTNWLSGGGGTCSFHIQGDGTGYGTFDRNSHQQ